MKHEFEDPKQPLDRRSFIKGGSFATLMAMMGGVEITAQDAKVLEVPKADPNYKEKEVGPPVRCGLIGFGSWGREIASAMSRLPNAPLAGVAETYGSSLRRVKRSAPDATAYEDYRKLLDQKDIPAIIVATPSHQHKQVVLDALAAGKHVYCEAPMGSSIEDAKTIALAAKKATKQVFQVGLQNLANPQHHHVYNFITTGAMGRPLMSRCQYHKKSSWRSASPVAERERELNWRLDPALSSGLIGEIGIQHIATASWYFRNHPVAVTGFGGILHWQDGRKVDDTVHAVFEYPDNVRLMVDITLGNSFQGEVENYYGTDSAILLRDRRAWMFKEVDSPLLGWEVYARKDEFLTESGIALVANATKLLAQGKKPAEGASDSEAPHFYSLEAFIGHINESTQPHANWELGYINNVVAVKANQAIRESKRIELTPNMFELA